MQLLEPTAHDHVAPLLTRRADAAYTPPQGSFTAVAYLTDAQQLPCQSPAERFVVWLAADAGVYLPSTPNSVFSPLSSAATGKPLPDLAGTMRGLAPAGPAIGRLPKRAGLVLALTPAALRRHAAPPAADPPSAGPVPPSRRR